MTNFQAKSLKTIRDNPGISATEFGKKMWPHSYMHDKISKGCSFCGKAAWLCAGSHVGKLIKKGWVVRGVRDKGYFLTDKGLSLFKGINFGFGS